MRYGSLFAGVGGFDQGFDGAGWECAWQVEIDPQCQDVLAYHWPEVNRFGDVRDPGAHDLSPVDAIVGGFPCQDISVAGRRAGLSGARSGLWWEFHRILGELRPAWCVIENVPGLLSSNGGRDLGTILWALGDLGYGWAYRVLDAQWFGLAQRRRRVFIVGHLGDYRAVQVLLEPEGGGRDTAPSREARTRVAAGLTAGAAGPGVNQPGRRLEDDESLVAGTLLAPKGGGRRTDVDGMTYVAVTQALTRSLGAGGVDDNRAQAGFLVAPTLVGRYAKGTDSEDGTGRGVPLVASFMFPDLRPHDDRHPGMAREKPSLHAMANDLLYAGGVRRLTPVECERLMGWPDGWTEYGASGKRMSDSTRYRMCGNGVVAPVAEWIGRRMVATEASP